MDRGWKPLLHQSLRIRAGGETAGVIGDDDRGQRLNG
jgi:hypothetical protein